MSILETYRKTWLPMVRGTHVRRATAGLVEHAQLLEARNGELLEALKELSESVERLRASGDAGNWEPEDDPYYMKALRAIAKAEGRE